MGSTERDGQSWVGQAWPMTGGTRRDQERPLNLKCCPGGWGQGTASPPALHRLTLTPSKFQITENRRLGKKKQRELRRAEQSRAAAPRPGSLEAPDGSHVLGSPCPWQ